ncbi:MAG: metal ABC transporter solute-binding protein, Zn/Mn family [Acidimicrobiia bacterium]
MKRWLALLVTLALVGAGCAHSSPKVAAGKIGVVAAFYPVAAAAQRVGGSCVQVTNLTPAGAEPNDLELVPDQVDAIQDAKVVFVMGHGFQPAVEKAAAQRDGPTVRLLDRLDPTSNRDPHVWLDPVRYSKLVDAVTAALVKADPKCRTTFEQNATRYRAEIDQVGRQYAVGLRDCKRHTIVTAHEAFGYLARRYGLTQEGIAGISPDEEPNAQRIADLADIVRRKGVTTIFTEELVSPRVADALAREAGGVKTETLNALEGLTDNEIARGAGWASVMRDNLTKIEAALGCSHP